MLTFYHNFFNQTFLKIQISMSNLQTLANELATNKITLLVSNEMLNVKGGWGGGYGGGSHKNKSHKGSHKGSHKRGSGGHGNGYGGGYGCGCGCGCGCNG